MSRRGRDYPTADYYEERERDFYRRGPRRTTREYEDFDVELSRPRSNPDFFREDYGRTSSGPLVERERREEVDIDDTRSVRSNATSRRPARREVEREEVIIREDDRRPRERPRERERDVEREEFIVRRGEGARTPRPRTEERETEIEIRRDDREPPRPRVREREVVRDEVDVRSVRSERPPPPRPIPREREVEREEFIVRRGEGERPPRREVEKEEITIRTNEAERPRSRRPSPRREVDREEILIRQTSRDEDTRSVRSSRPREVSEEREKITIRERSRSRPRGPLPRDRGDLVARETEEFVIRRRRPPSPSPSPSPPPRRDVEREQIIIRERKERSPSPIPAPLPPPPLEPEPVRLPPIIRPPIHQEIHQEIITHHRHIDHGMMRARSRSVSRAYRRTGVERARELILPPPPPPPEEKVESTEIEIKRRYGSTRFRYIGKRANIGRSGNGRNDEEEIKIERKSRDLERLSARSERGDDEIITRSRSVDVPRRRYYDDDLEAEADFYNRRALERGYPGEAYNGATRDWAIVDVPPGTERVKLDGAGGGSQEITWQRYNGVRRSKFIAGDREFDSPFGLPAPPEAVDDRRVLARPRGTSIEINKSKKSEMWTEITKDLVSKEAIDYMGYDYEETEYFFYVMEYLRYVSSAPSLRLDRPSANSVLQEDVLQLVELSDDLRRERRKRIREIEWERQDPRLPRPPVEREREYYERDVIIDRKRGF